MKKIILMLITLLFSITAFAFIPARPILRPAYRHHSKPTPVKHVQPKPAPKPAPKPVHKPAPPIHKYHPKYEYHHSSYFWPGVLTGVLLHDAIKPAPPGPYANMVWVEGHYEDRLQPNGTIVRVWVPGQYVLIQ